MALGLLVDGKIDLALSIVEHCIFEIKHYNKVLNGNRTYVSLGLVPAHSKYLGRSQPPFFTDLALQLFNQMDRNKREQNKAWLKRAITSAIKEYHSYWMVEPALDIETGLSRYRPSGQGIPPETEASHFTHILQPYAQKLGISVNEYIDGYNDRSILEPELDEYFQHDRGVRESGHDTSYRLEKRCADLATVDLNSLLYKVSRKSDMADVSTKWIFPKPCTMSLTTSSSSKTTLNCHRGLLRAKTLRNRASDPLLRFRQPPCGRSEPMLGKRQWTDCAGIKEWECTLTMTPRLTGRRDTNRSPRSGRCGRVARPRSRRICLSRMPCPSLRLLEG